MGLGIFSGQLSPTGWLSLQDALVAPLSQHMLHDGHLGTWVPVPQWFSPEMPLVTLPSSSCRKLRNVVFHMSRKGQRPRNNTVVWMKFSNFYHKQWVGLVRQVQFSSVTQLCPTLCDPVNCSTPGLPVHHHLPEFTQTHVHRVGDAIQPSHPLSCRFSHVRLCATP